MKRENLERELKARVSEEMYAALEKLLSHEEEGVKISDLVRRAVRLYIDSKNPRKQKAAKRRAADEEEL
jgi:hypothetical protein